ncbi:DEAD/DEAH box helicase [Phocaeicola dorei]|nr:DEAD/DEAH box helicase [Phocaeicola dorei]
MELVKRIPSVKQNIRAAYIADEKAWKVSLQDKEYVRMMADWAVQTKICSRVQHKVTTREYNDYTIPDLPKLTVPHGLLLEPYEYQKEGIAYALQHKRCIFGDQPGLGKTLQAIGTVTIAKAYPCLVICPAALKINWQREFKKFAGKNAMILDDRNKASWHRFFETKCCNIFITNYESLKKFFVLKVKEDARFTMKSIEFDPRISLFKSVVIDESHKCKSTKTQQSKFVEGICKGKEYILELTGTPVVNNNTDLIQQLKIMGRLEDFGGYKYFVERFCDGPKQSSNVKELNWRLSSTCFFRREKAKVLTQLPDKSRQYIEVDISNRKEYDKAEADLIQYLRTYKNADDEKVAKALRGEVMVKMGILKAISARGKIKVFSEFIHDVIDGGEKLIVFAYLKEVVQELKKIFPEAVTVTGEDNATQKQTAVDRFQNAPSCKLIILNYKSGGTGLTLTASSRVAFIEFPWTFSDCEQAEDRAHRNGQKNNVNCYYYLGKDTIDKYMYDVIQTKKGIANGVTGTDDVVKENVVDMAMNLFNGRI